MSELKRWNFYVPICKSSQTDGGDWVIEGPLSNPDEDLQGETMDMSGLRKGLKTYERLGQNLDWEHLYRQTKDPAFLIGKGVEMFDAPHPKSGADVPWLRAKLFKNKKIAKHAIEHLEEGGTLGYSVEGGAIRKSGTHILEPVITMVTVTPQPVVSENTGTVTRVLKGLQALATDWDGVELPTIPALLCPISDEAFKKAMTATGALPHSGPGVSAAEVEDLDHEAAVGETCPVCERAKSACRCAQLRKALAYQLAEELAYALA